MAEETSPLRVALLGAGVVGSQVARILTQEAEPLRQRIGRPLELVGIGVRRLGVERPGIDPELFTTDVHGLVSRGDLDLVIEVIGGIEPARTLLTQAMNAGASVITANKALLAEDLGPRRKMVSICTTRLPSRAQSRSSGLFGNRWWETRSVP